MKHGSVVIILAQAKKAIKDLSDLFMPAALMDYIVSVRGVWLSSLHLWQLWVEAKINESPWLKCMAKGEVYWPVPKPPESQDAVRKIIVCERTENIALYFASK